MIPTYRKCEHNLGQSKYNLLTNHTHDKIVIVPPICLDLFRRQYDVDVKLTE